MTTMHLGRCLLKAPPPVERSLVGGVLWSWRSLLVVLVAGREKEIERRGVTVNGDNGCWGVRGEAVMELLSHAWGHGAELTLHTLVGDVSAGRNLTSTFCQRQVQECFGSSITSKFSCFYLEVGTVLRRPEIKKEFTANIGKKFTVEIAHCAHQFMMATEAFPEQKRLSISTCRGALPAGDCMFA